MNKSMIGIICVVMSSAPLLIYARETPAVENGPRVSTFNDQTHPQLKAENITAETELKSEDGNKVFKTKKKQRKEEKSERIREQKQQGTWPEPDKERTYGIQPDSARSAGKNQDGSRNPGVTADSERKLSAPNSERKIIETTPKKMGASEDRKTYR